MNQGKCPSVRVLWLQFWSQKKLVRNGGVETYIAVTLSKTVVRTCHFTIGRIHASMNASLKLKRNDSGQVSFGSSFVASVLVAKHVHD